MRNAVPRGKSKAGNPHVAPATGYSGAAVSDIPVLVRLAETQECPFRYAHSLSEGRDIRFETLDGTELPSECDMWDTTGESAFWVRVPELRAGLVLTMRYGRAGDTGPAVSPWSGYKAIWHMNPKTTASGVAAAETVAGYDARAVGTDHITWPAGAIGTCYLNAAWRTNDIPRLVIDDDASLTALADMPQAVTFSCWLRNDGGSGYGTYQGKNQRNYGRWWNTANGSFSTSGSDGLDYAHEGYAGSESLADHGPRATVDLSLSGSWHHFAVAYDGANKTRRVYCDGQVVTAGA